MCPYYGGTSISVKLPPRSMTNPEHPTQSFNYIIRPVPAREAHTSHPKVHGTRASSVSASPLLSFQHDRGGPVTIVRSSHPSPLYQQRRARSVGPLGAPSPDFLVKHATHPPIPSIIPLRHTPPVPTPALRVRQYAFQSFALRAPLCHGQ
jgi:hypothetical protein